MIYNINLHHRLIIGGGAVGRVGRDQPSSVIELDQDAYINPQFSVYSYLSNFKPTFGLEPEAYITGGCAYIKDPAGPETLVGTSDKYICIDGYDGAALTHQRPRAKNLVALMYWLDQLNEWHEWGLTPLFKFYQVSDQTSSLHTFVINDTILDGENWTHVDIIQQIRNRIHEIARLLGFSDGSKFYLGQVGYSYFLPTDADANPDSKDYTESLWASERLEIGEFGKFKFTEYSEVFPGIMWGGAKTKETVTEPGTNFPTSYDRVNASSGALHQGFSVTPGNHLFYGLTDNTANIVVPLNSYDVVDYDWTVENDNAASLVGAASSSNSFTPASNFRYALNYQYNGYLSFGNPRSTQGGTSLLQYENNPAMNCVYLGGKTILNRYGYKQADPLAYYFKSTGIETIVASGNTLTAAQVFNNFTLAYKLNLYKSNNTTFNKKDSYSYQIHHDFYHSFELVETIKEYSFDLLSTPNLNSGVWTGGVFGSYLPLIEADTVDLSPLWDIDDAQWAGLRLDIEVSFSQNDPETFVTPGIGTTLFSYEVRSAFKFENKAVSSQDYYLPFFSTNIGQPTNPVWAPNSLRGLYPTTGTELDKYIRNSFWTH